MRPTNERAEWPADAVGAVDFSNWDWNYAASLGDPEVVFAEHCRQLVALGYRDAIVGCQNPGFARRVIAHWTAAGGQVRAVYSWVYAINQGSTEWASSAARDVAREFGIAWHAHDCEEEGYTPQLSIAMLDRSIEVSGLRPIVYTGQYVWRDHWGETKYARARVPLWHAAYPWDRTPVTAVAYGGWKLPHIHQFSSQPPPWDPMAGGRPNRDFNAVLIAPWEDDMTEDQVRAIARDEAQRAIEERVDDGETKGAGLVSTNAFLELTQQAIGMKPSTFADAAGNPDPRPAEIAEYVTGGPAGTKVPPHTHVLEGVTGGVNR